MNHRNNRRSEATKNKIKQTLVDMLHEQDISKITVQALCEKASINRSTFYNHYQSPLSVLKKMEKDFAAELTSYLQSSVKPETDSPDLTLLLTRILEFIQANKNICFLLQTPGIKPEFKNNLFQNIFNSSLSNHPIFENYSDEALVYVQTFFLYGIGHVIDLWLRDGCKESPLEIASILTDFTTKK